MASRLCMFALAFLLTLGCIYHRKPMPVSIVTHIVSPYQQYVARNFDWSTVHRVVLMPVANQTAFPQINEQIHTNLAAELQRAGRFEVVAAKIEDPAARAQDVFASGQFNEIETLRVAREYHADAVLFANVTQYHPYNPPKLGIALLLVNPAEGIAIASVSGLWDAREAQTLQLAQAYLRQNQSWPRSLIGPERVVEMPDVFQRFVCHQIAGSLHPSTPQTGPQGVMDNNGIIPAEATNPVETTLPVELELPPVPPSSMELP